MAAFRRDGIDVRLNTTVDRVRLSGAEKIVPLKTDGQEGELRADEIPVGAGRSPDAEELNLEGAGVQYDTRLGVLVNDYLQTTQPGIYAAGDVCLSHKFTHTADATARIVIQNTLFGGRKKQCALTILWCTYTDPEIAHVGLYERDAATQGIAVVPSCGISKRWTGPLPRAKRKGS